MDYKARKSKGMGMEEPASSNNGVPLQGTRRDASSSFSWRIDGGVVSLYLKYFNKDLFLYLISPSL